MIKDLYQTIDLAFGAVNSKEIVSLIRALGIPYAVYMSNGSEPDEVIEESLRQERYKTLGKFFLRANKNFKKNGEGIENFCYIKFNYCRIGDSWESLMKDYIFGTAIFDSSWILLEPGCKLQTPRCPCQVVTEVENGIIKKLYY